MMMFNHYLRGDIMKDKTEIVVPPVVIDVVIADEKAEPRRAHRESKTSAGLRGSFMGSSLSFFVSRDTVVDEDEEKQSKSKVWCC